MLRIDARDLDAVRLAETGRLVEQGVTITRADFVLANNTIVWGDSKGRISGGFLVRLPTKLADPDEHAFVERYAIRDAERAEGETNTFVVTKHLMRSGPKLTSMVASQRSRLMLCGFEDGSMRLYNVTNEGQLAEAFTQARKPIHLLVMAPKEDGILAIGDDAVNAYDFDPMFHEVTMAALFLPVWYEGYSKPEHTWQSSAGHTGAEPKFGMMPLMFGTIKATVYAMLFGAPLALLAAIYSSEFLHPRIKAGVKPTIEMMASLPSVVLGFVAALVFAPLVEDIVPTMLAAFLTLPLAFLFGAYVWQLLPHQWTLRLSHARFGFFILPVLLGIAGAVVVGPVVQSTMFHGELKGWLQYSARDAQIASNELSQAAAAAGETQAASDASRMADLIGDSKIAEARSVATSLAGTLKDKDLAAKAAGMAHRLLHHNSTYGWMILLLPLAGIFTALLYVRTVGEWLRRHATDWSRTKLAWADLAKFVSGLIVACLIALIAGALLNQIGFDPRGPWKIWGLDFSVMGTYQQRNSLIVGFFMGFAVIPIIYTIADDALTSVPEHLRSASLGAGATPWQTSIRIVIPTAMSGLFSALMIGLGRAVGETMIVLMATGNTPVLQMNVFNGLRTLSANIAVELPEAPKGDVHFRTLFFAALVLFAMTFMVNLVAEMVRLRFRKRAVAL
ncbi:MAG: ABC transporter permease subunit [Phycisphaera sp.]|nr:ABC transporter permease subunit [Phycisphaera sp.]